MINVVGQTSPVRKGAQLVMGQASHVHVNKERIPDIVDYLLDSFSFKMSSWDDPVYPSVTNPDVPVEDVIDFMMVGNALNYCFNYVDSAEKYRVIIDGEEYTGAWAMWASLHETYKENPDILNPEVLMNVTPNDVETMFSRGVDRSIPMFDTRVTHLHVIGERMAEYQGTFAGLFSDPVRLYGNNGIVEILSNSPPFVDKRTYNGKVIRFDKRAQLTVSMLYGKLYDSNHGFTIHDMDEFTVFADYGIPAGLATHGVIEYSDDLHSKIMHREPIPVNSNMETEIRAATVVAADIIKEQLENKHGIDAPMPILDSGLWHMRQERDVPVHLTECTAY